MTLVNWLVPAANLVGLIGSGLLLVPFFRTQTLLRRRDDLDGVQTGGHGLKEQFREAAEHAQERLARFEPADQLWVIAGLVCLGLSYLLNIVVWSIN
jgi:hypothetical protein